MPKVGRDQDFDEIFSKIGPDATATFDNSASTPTDHASSEATNAATAVDGEDEELEEDDDDAATSEEDDEEDEKRMWRTTQGFRNKNNVDRAGDFYSVRRHPRPI